MTKWKKLKVNNHITDMQKRLVLSHEESMAFIFLYTQINERDKKKQLQMARKPIRNPMAYEIMSFLQKIITNNIDMQNATVKKLLFDTLMVNIDNHDSRKKLLSLTVKD